MLKVKLQHLKKNNIFSEFIRVHLVFVVTFVLFLAWVMISWRVYQVEKAAQGANIMTFADGLWWGIVTFLTVGYGDKYPVTMVGRVYATFLMLAGVLSVAIITSKISSYFLEQILRRERGVVNSSRLNNHLVICGWREEIEELLREVIEVNQGMKPSDIVLIANLATGPLTILRDHPELQGLNIIVGDFLYAAYLKSAALERARKVLILSDYTPHPNGESPTVVEMDAKTIMAALTISHLARGTIVAAELLDHKMDQYLKLASVNEIIYSREYSRLLLGNSFSGNGVCNIFFDLLNPQKSTFLITQHIPEIYFQKLYSDFKRDFEEKHPLNTVIGILENTGNSHRIKEIALRKAQMTPDMGKLVENLRQVKEIKFNHPVFSPPKNYKIEEGVMAIVIETRPEVLENGKQNQHASAVA